MNHRSPMPCVALVIVLLMWLALCMALVSSCFHPYEEGDEDQTPNTVSREVAVRVVCVGMGVALLIAVASKYSC